MFVFLFVSFDFIKESLFEFILREGPCEEGHEELLFRGLDFDGDGLIKAHCLRWLRVELKRLRKKQQAKENAAKARSSKQNFIHLIHLFSLFIFIYLLYISSLGSISKIYISFHSSNITALFCAAPCRSIE